MFDYTSLPGRNIVLEPLDARHTPDLIDAALTGQSMFEMRRTVHLHSQDEVREWVAESIQLARSGDCLPYAIIDVDSARAVGTTWYRSVDDRNHTCEIGWTWMATHLRGTTVSLESKLLMLEHAFAHGVKRVEFRVDAYDDRSKRLLDRIGATLEGVLRGNYVDRGGLRRDTMLFSIVAEEWPRLRRRLEQRIGGAIGEGERHATVQRLESAHGRRQAPQDLELPLPRS